MRVRTIMEDCERRPLLPSDGGARKSREIQSDLNHDPRDLNDGKEQRRTAEKPSWKFLKDDNFGANERGGLLKVMVKQRIRQKRTKYVDECLTLFVRVLIL